MALPLKTGGDFYNNQALRMCLHCLGADPVEVKNGLIYFNTGDSNHGKHACIYDGTAFRALAFVDEIANDTEFQALKTKVNTIDKMLNVDSAEGVVSTWQEIQDFLASIGEDKDLMDMLNGKLDKSGGTIEGQSNILLTINTTTNTSSIIFQKSNVDKAQFGWDNGLGAFISNANSGNSICVRDDGSPNFYNGKYNTLLHSGNIVNVYHNLNDATGARFFSGDFQPLNRPNLGVNYACGLTMQDIANNVRHQIAFDNIGGLFARSERSNEWLNWKTIAFTDSNVASATKLQTARTIWGQSFDGTADIKGNFITNEDLILDTTIYTDVSYARGLVWKNYGQDIANICYVSISGGKYINITHGAFNSTNGIRILDNGNVGIGADKPSTRLEIGGVITLPVNNQIQWKDTGTMIYGSGNSTIQMVGNVKTSASLEVGVNLGVVSNANINGTLSVSGKTTISNDTRITGNLVVDGQISWGGPAKEEDPIVSTGIDVLVEYIEVGATTKSIPNKFVSEDLQITLYEWDATDNSWNMCLADIAVRTTNIEVTFGEATSVRHKLVAIG